MVSSKKNSNPRPFVMLNMAMTADGKIASSGKTFSRFGSAADGDRLYKIRNKADAILAGASTLRAERATLESPHSKRAPFRILATGKGSLSLDAPFFSTPVSSILILTTASISPNRRRQYEAKCRGIHQSEGNRIDWQSALHWLWKRWNLRRLLVEGGGELNQSLFRGGFVDEIYLTICPVIIGGKTSATLAGGDAFPNLDACSKWSMQSRRVLGGECFLKYRAKGKDQNKM